MKSKKKAKKTYPYWLVHGVQKDGKNYRETIKAETLGLAIHAAEMQNRGVHITAGWWLSND